MMGYGYSGYNGPFNWFGTGFSIITHVASTVLIIMAAIWFYRTIFHGSTHSLQHQDTALDILKQRYARGEITSEEFHRIKKDLE
ncbi:SHOCT domain-containing protein [Pectinatus sottacetonis]|uniref:SHOCT domain-containing protein n=1 Tax=Pectinatus sottacetonis TaxID=1002795 RepID=UPI001E4876F1|nr:SHOCT domain-containing protein [Pectinatus sottacetonis]